jgi:peroxiredoxin
VCRKEAFRVNDLYSAIQRKKDLKSKIKLIGIGIGNTREDIEYFKKKYKVPFPLFADPDNSIHKKLGNTRAPYFIGIKMTGDGSPLVFYSKLGGFKNPDEFLGLMLELSGLSSP